jgi:hypothetical protein
MSERFVQEELSWRRGNQVVTSDNLGYSLSGIVDDDGQLVCRAAVGFPDDKIASPAPEVNSGGTEIAIQEFRWLVGCRGMVQAEAPGEALNPERGSFDGTALCAGARICRSLMVGVRRAGSSLDVEPAARAGIDSLVTSQLLQRGVVMAKSLALNDRPFVPVESEPAQILAS